MHPTATLVLVLDELLSVVALLVRHRLEELVESGESHIVTLKVRSHGEVSVRGSELGVDLGVDALLGGGGEVLAAERHVGWVEGLGEGGRSGGAGGVAGEGRWENEREAQAHENKKEGAESMSELSGVPPLRAPDKRRSRCLSASLCASE